MRPTRAVLWIFHSVVVVVVVFLLSVLFLVVGDCGLLTLTAHDSTTVPLRPYMSYLASHSVRTTCVTTQSARNRVLMPFNFGSCYNDGLARRV